MVVTKESLKSRRKLETVTISVRDGVVRCDRERVDAGPGVQFRWVCEDHPFAVLFKGAKTPFAQDGHTSRTLPDGTHETTPAAIVVHPPEDGQERFEYGIVVAAGDELLTKDPEIVVFG